MWRTRSSRLAFAAAEGDGCDESLSPAARRAIEFFKVRFRDKNIQFAVYDKISSRFTDRSDALGHNTLYLIVDRSPLDREIGNIWRAGALRFAS